MDPDSQAKPNSRCLAVGCCCPSALEGQEKGPPTPEGPVEVGGVEEVEGHWCLLKGRKHPGKLRELPSQYPRDTLETHPYTDPAVVHSGGMVTPSRSGLALP